MAENTSLNLYQKLAAIRRSVCVLQKNKSGYGYKYVSEDEVLAKVTAGMDKYHLSLIPKILTGTTSVVPYQYIDKKGKQASELIVSADMAFRWVDNDNPEDFLEVPWFVVGQQADAAQAFGAGLTYTNRYFLLKYFQLATVEDDPDNYRQKKKEAEDAGDEDELAQCRADIIAQATAKIQSGVPQKEVYDLIAKHTGGKKNPNSIKDLDVAKTVLDAISKMEVKKSA